PARTAFPLPPQSTLFPSTTLFRSSIFYRGLDIADGRLHFFFYFGNFLDIHFPLNIAFDIVYVALRAPHQMAQRTGDRRQAFGAEDRKSTRLNSSHVKISYAVFCL